LAHVSHGTPRIISSKSQPVFFWKSMSIFRSPTDRQLDQSSVLARVGCWVLVGDNGREGAGIRLEAVDFVTIVF